MGKPVFLSWACPLEVCRKLSFGISVSFCICPAHLPSLWGEMAQLDYRVAVEVFWIENPDALYPCENVRVWTCWLALGLYPAGKTPLSRDNSPPFQSQARPTPTRDNGPHCPAVIPCPDGFSQRYMGCHDEVE